MVIYFAILVLILLLSLFDISYSPIKNNKIKKDLLIVLGFILVLFAGLRWETGTDWNNYYYFFSTVKQFDIGESGFEILFELLARIISSIFRNYHFMLIATALIIILFTYRTIYKFSPYPILSILLLYTYSLNSSGFGYRQDIAIAICFFSFLFIYRRKFIPFILCILSAFLFHQSALIFIPAYWIFTIKWNIKIVLIYLGSTLLSYILVANIETLITLFFSSEIHKLEQYTSDFESSTTGILIGIMNRVIILFIPILIILNNKDKDTVFLKGILNILLLGTIMYIVLSPLGTVFTRFTRYYDIFQIIILPYSLFVATKNEKVAYWILILLYYIFKFAIVMITDQQIYIPYRTDLL